MNLNYDKNLKELEIILSDFTCDKNCPYCTAKITKWPSVEDDIHSLELYVGQLKKLGYTFHYVTIGGNGEPTLHDYNKLKEIVKMFEDYDIPVKRVLTSGNIFREAEKDKWELFVSHDWMFECTTATFDHKKDQKILGYNHNYFDNERFKKSRIRLNYVLLKNNIDTFIDEIGQFLTKYPNIETFSLKLLNVNTKTGEADNPLSEWILKHAIPKTDRDKIAEKLNENFSYNGETFDACSWQYDETHEVYFSWKKGVYGSMDLVYYGNQFVDYQLNDSKIQLLPKTYIAARFKKSKTEDGKLSLNNDFRNKLIGKENLFMDFNNETFLYNEKGEPKLQYIGPFYNEKASDGTMTSNDCDEVVRTENNLIDKCDIFLCYFDEVLSPGGITELIYAAFKKKKIVIFFKVEDDVSYSCKTSSWYPITTVKQMCKDAKIIPVKDENEVIDYIHKNIETLT